MNEKTFGYSENNTYICNMKDRYETYSHSKTYIRYHFIFSTKYRRNCLVGMEQSVKECFDKISSKCNFKVLEVGVDKNHVHLYVKSCPTMSIHEIVKRLKRMSTFYLWQEHYVLLSKYYWKKTLLWTRGYFCSTVGIVCENNILNYVKNQG